MGASTIARDITDLKVLDRMKEEFVGTVSHELRTPLTAIKGFIELVTDGEAGPINDVQRDFLTIAGRNSDRLSALINDLLDMNRIESQHLEMTMQPIDLAHVLGEVENTMRVQAQAKGLNFSSGSSGTPQGRG